MQKKLIALAVAGLVAAPAFAQSNVTIYGRLDYGYLNATTDRDGVETKSNTTGFGAGALTTSRLGFKGSEDLGNGLKAFFQYEMKIDSTTKSGGDTGDDLADSFTTRLALVGLSGSFGSVSLGRQYTLVETAWGVGAAGATNNATGALYTAQSLQLGKSAKMNNTRSDELVTYMAPEMSGVKLGVQYGKGSTQVDGTPVGDKEHKEVGFLAQYGNGPLNVALGYSKESGRSDLGDINSAKSLVLGANYDFGVVKAFGTFMNGSDDDGGVDKSKGWELGLNAPVGPVVLVASYFDGKMESTANVETDTKGYQLGALYPLSKRTIVYTLYGVNKEDGDNSYEGKVKNFAVGLRHDF